MTTRRGFIQGTLAVIGAAVVQKVARAMPVDEPDMAALNTLRGIPIEFSRPENEVCLMPVTSPLVPLDNFSKVCVYYNGGCAEYRLDVTDYTDVKWLLVRDWPDDETADIVIVDPPLAKATTFTSPLASTLEEPGSATRDTD